MEPKSPRNSSVPPGPYGASSPPAPPLHQPMAEAPPCVAPQQAVVSNGLMWVQAFVPLIGVAFAFGGLVLFLLNVVLCYADEKQLKKQGYSVEGLGTAWLVPVYLYKREKMFPQGKGYFLVWCICFGLSFF